MRALLLAFLSVGLALTAQAAVPTFYGDVLPIFEQHCQTCHRPGEAAPMPLLTYESTRPWAKAIKQAVITRKMPPWFADPSIGHFANDRTLSDAAIQTISQHGSTQAHRRAKRGTMRSRLNSSTAGPSANPTSFSKCPRPRRFLHQVRSLIST